MPWSSLVFQTLSEGVASSSDLLRLLLAAPGEQRRPALLFAGVNLLLASQPGSELAAYYPIHGGQRPVDDQLLPAFPTFCAGHRDVLVTSRLGIDQHPSACPTLIVAPGWNRSSGPRTSKAVPFCGRALAGPLARRNSMYAIGASLRHRPGRHHDRLLALADPYLRWLAPAGGAADDFQWVNGQDARLVGADLRGLPHK